MWTEFADHIDYYLEQKLRKSLFERYVANSLGVIARLEKTYDDVLEVLDRKLHPELDRTAEDIKSDLLKKFNKKES